MFFCFVFCYFFYHFVFFWLFIGLQLKDRPWLLIFLMHVTQTLFYITIHLKRLQNAVQIHIHLLAIMILSVHWTLFYKPLFQSLKIEC